MPGSPMKSRANTEQSFFDKVPTEEQKALIQTALWLKSVISYPPEEQSKGKSPKFRGSDAMDILIAQNFVASEDAASKTLLLMERVGLLACSKGTGKSPKKEAAPRMRRYRFSADSRLSAAAENLNDDATAVATLIDAPPVHALVQFKVLRIVAFLVAIACLLGPVSICDTLPVNVEPESLKLYGSFILGLCVCLLFVDEPENVQEVAQLTRDADAKRASRTSSAGVKQIPASEENNIPTVDIKKVLISLAEVTRMTGEYEWITAGRLLTACQRAVDGADPESVVGKHAKVLLESEAMEDCRERYMVAVEGLGLLAKEDGWVLFSENAAGTKVYSKYEDGGFWIKVDGKLHIGGNACAAVWKEGDLYHKWFPQVGWSKIFYQESDAEIVFSYGGTTPIGKTESILRGWGCNNLKDGSFLILGGSVSEWRGKKFPKPGLLTTRNEVPVLSLLVEPVSETECRNVLVSCLELPPLPEWLLKWILGKVFLMLYGKMENCAKAAMAEKDNKDTKNEHAKRIRENSFYSDFLNPRFANFLNSKKSLN